MDIPALLWSTRATQFCWIPITPTRFPAFACLPSAPKRCCAATSTAEIIKILPGPENPFTIRTVEVFHDHHSGEHRGANTVHILEADGIRVAHLGDLGHLLTPEQAQKLQWLDAVMIPVGGHYTIDAAEAKQVVNAIHPRVVIPMHYQGHGYDYPVIAPVENFLDLCENVHEYVNNTIEITPDTKAQTAVLALPSIVRK